MNLYKSHEIVINKAFSIPLSVKSELHSKKRKKEMEKEVVSSGKYLKAR